MAEATLSAINYFMPIFAFLLVFIVVYALLKTSKVLGNSEAVLLFVSLILASFFIVESSLVEFIQFSSAWFAGFAVVAFFLIVALAFVPGIELKDFFGKKNWFAIVLFVGLILVFIFSSIHVFNWALNWGMVRDWVNTEWFGMILLLAIAGLVSWKIAKG